MLFYDSTLSHLPYFYVTAQVLTNGSELEINHFKQAPLRALSKSLTTNKNLQVMKPKWTVKKLENGQIVQVYDELSDFKYFTIPWSHHAATMKDQPAGYFDIHQPRIFTMKFPKLEVFPVVDDDDKSQILKWMLWPRRGWPGDVANMFMVGWYYRCWNGRCGLFLIEREWSKEEHGLLGGPSSVCLHWISSRG